MLSSLLRVYCVSLFGWRKLKLKKKKKGFIHTVLVAIMVPFVNCIKEVASLQQKRHTDNNSVRADSLTINWCSSSGGPPGFSL